MWQIIDDAKGPAGVVVRELPVGLSINLKYRSTDVISSMTTILPVI
jgi:hypothetical protein